MWNDLNNLSLLIYFQCQHYFIYRIDDIRTTKKKEIYFNLNLHHDAASFQTIFNRKKKKRFFKELLHHKEDLKV